MAKQKIWFFFSGFALFVSIVMRHVGNTNRNLSELQDFWFYPLPLAVIWFMTGVKKANIAQANANNEPETNTTEGE